MFRRVVFNPTGCLFLCFPVFKSPALQSTAGRGRSTRLEPAQPGTVALWHCGTVALWHRGTVALWHCPLPSPLSGAGGHRQPALPSATAPRHAGAWAAAGFCNPELRLRVPRAGLDPRESPGGSSHPRWCHSPAATAATSALLSPALCCHQRSSAG